MTQNGSAVAGSAIARVTPANRDAEPDCRQAQANLPPIDRIGSRGGAPALAHERRIEGGRRDAHAHLLPWFCLSIAIVTALLSSTTALSQMAMVIVFGCAAVTSIAGFAFSPLAGALLFQFFDPVQTIEILLVASISIQAYNVWSIRQAINVRELMPYVLGGAVSVPPGVYLLLNTNAGIYIPLLGCFLIAYGAYALMRPRLPTVADTLAARIIVGALGGLTAALAAFPGASISIWCRMQNWDKQRQRATVQPYILAMQVLVLGVLAAVRPRNALPLELLQFVAPAILGAYLGFWLYDRLSTAQFNRVVALLLLVSGLILTARSF